MARPRAEMKDTDKGFRSLVRRFMRSAKSPTSLTVGIHEEEGSEEVDKGDGLTIAELGEIHEFGLGVPQRSFIGGWVDESLEEKKRDIKAVAKAMANGLIETLDEGYAQLGNLYVAQIQKRITEHIPPPLAQVTIDQKGSDVPLVNTGQLKGAITFRVRAGRKNR